jgi:acetyl-CoA carboxylase biotin carboxylase subunit
MIRKVLVANRGEIAVRVIRACQELGFATVAVHSNADRDALHVALADERVDIGGPSSRSSYLNMAAIIGAAWQTNADSIHPGYGFLSENAQFAGRCREANLTFIGPSPESIRSMGDKASALRMVSAMGVPIIEGADVDAANPEYAAQEAVRIGFPVLIKASAGGGGRGMLVVEDAADLPSSLVRASAEAQAAFGDGRVYLERYISDARHVEVQVFGDGAGGGVHLFERDCSVQRRHQKLVEESPSTAIDATLRQELCAAAVRIVETMRYANAGTIEFLVDRQARRFYFIEMNTRLQVEHPVTEMVTGVDLVRAQLLFAGTGQSGLHQYSLHANGHSIECRINAEDAAKGFMPCPGRIDEFVPPSGPGVRVDTFCRAGAVVPPFYDSMIAKVIVHAPDRDQAIARMSAALGAFRISGITTTAPFHRRLMNDDRFRRGQYNTRWIDSGAMASFAGGS